MPAGLFDQSRGGGQIERAPAAAATDFYDLIVIGGGIYGIGLALEAARRGLKTVLVERADFGGVTSWSSPRILHGGLRYLQSLDLVRFYESVGERNWFLRNFPDLVRPLPCLMPLCGRGLKRPALKPVPVDARKQCRGLSGRDQPASGQMERARHARVATPRQEVVEHQCGLQGDQCRWALVRRAGRAHGSGRDASPVSTGPGVQPAPEPAADRRGRAQAPGRPHLLLPAMEGPAARRHELCSGTGARLFEATPSAPQIEAFLIDLNRALPGLNATADDVLQVYAGLLPAKSAATIDLADREVISDHGAAGGPKGLFSVSGVKYTTARLVAERTLAKAFGKALPPRRAAAPRPMPTPGPGGDSILDDASPFDGQAERVAAELQALAGQESVLCLEDLLLRRLDSTLTVRDPKAAARARALLGWDRDKLPDVVPGHP